MLDEALLEEAVRVLGAETYSATVNFAQREDLRSAGVRVHRLAGDRRGFSAIEVSANLRIVFRFRTGNAFDVEVVDYHRI